MSTDPEFLDLMQRLRDGDDQAAAAIFRRFSGRLMEMARQRLGDRLRGVVGPEDVLQSAFRSFFLRQADGRLDPRDWDELWALLVTLTLRKCGAQFDRFYAARRDVRREVAAAPSDEDES